MTLFDELTKLKNKLDIFRPLPPEIMEVLDKKFKIDWTYHSNAIEGNTMTLQETAFFLQEGLTSKGKTLKEYLEAENHAEAIEFLKDIIKEQRVISESLIKELHALLLTAIDYIWVGPQENRIKKRIYPGRYKTRPNHVITMDGTIHHYCDPLRVPEEMEKLIDFIDQNREKSHPVVLAARVHHRLVAIHPFDDGNGRVVRLVMNLIVMRAGYPPIVIKNETREDYYLALSKADKGDYDDLLTLFHDEMTGSLKLMLQVVEQAGG